MPVLSLSKHGGRKIFEKWKLQKYRKMKPVIPSIQRANFLHHLHGSGSLPKIENSSFRYRSAHVNTIR
jgi:hypothetical protein